MIVPKNKTDFEGLNRASREDIILYQDELLEWLQDINWPVANKVCEVLTPYILEIEVGVIKVLKGTDLQWKINIIGQLLYSVAEIPLSILDEVKKIHSNPAEFIDLKEECEELFDKFGINY